MVAVYEISDRPSHVPALWWSGASNLQQPQRKGGYTFEYFSFEKRSISARYCRQVIIDYTVAIIIGVLRWILSLQLWILTHNALFIPAHLHFTPKTCIFFQEYHSLWKQNRTITSSSVRFYSLGKGCSYMSLCIMQISTKRNITFSRSYYKTV